ncbi:uncharacterized protein LOC133296547 [Gastrolobium bilobum]|uniref:uncharacterized protein LOC133296547 n=1 Tax=Gastrolobium bilobum TaxID=150636 RepID=UPI002AB1DF46|nr:uncharacterized protein LOC133296547 [Gastrolobium bilobum]
MRKVPRPPPIQSRYVQTNKTKWCEFHRGYGHHTDDCYNLQNVIERLIKEGELQKYVRRKGDGDNEDKYRRQDRSRSPPGGRSQDANKPRFKKERKKTGKQVVFKDLDEEIINPEHDDTLVISGLLANYRVNRMLVDSSSSVDIIFWDAFRRMDLDYEQLEPCGAELLAFTGDKIKPLGYIPLRLTLGKAPTHKTVTLSFAVVDLSSAYNIILGQPFMKKFKIFLSIDQLAMKFVAKDGSVATIKADQVVTRSCYNMSLRVPQASNGERMMEPARKAKEENMQGEKEGKKEERVLTPEPARDMEKVQLGISQQQCTKMGSELEPEVA